MRMNNNLYSHWWIKMGKVQYELPFNKESEVDGEE